MCEPPLPQFKIRLPKRGKRKRMALWNGHRPVSCQGHLCLEDKLWAMMERGEWAELFLNNLVILGYRCGRISKSSIYLSPLSACILTDKQGVSLPPTKWPYVSFPPLAVTHFIWHQSGKCEVKSLCACMWLQMCLCMSLYVHVWGVRMIQSAISLCEDSLHKHTSCRRCCHPPPHCLCKWCLQSPSNTWRFHPPSVTLLLCLLLQLYKLSHRPSAPAVSHLFHHSLLKRLFLKGRSDSSIYTRWCTEQGKCQTWIWVSSLYLCKQMCNSVRGP